MPINSKLSSLIYHARIKHGYTQKQVADAVSVSVRWYQRIEKGRKNPQFNSFAAFDFISRH